ncbi:endoplasmic reticulum-Golgi intermediate compartment protein 3-like [Dorcoceras hygrometricum]|uniref:Endoplasmic reticulum-Golgi intermediate compartment protein 3-like n=1 Tax=Dorcoceras hygrometricum TaxID=472368 RepID=A0A2Z7B7D4_9LAMI|nr:endoplasmic reticulum-Golgi intermediate compartment protein 3-like [Dorcoceras hygrometricum]
MTKAEIMEALKERKANTVKASSSRKPSKEKRKEPSERKERRKKLRNEEMGTESTRVTVPRILQRSRMSLGPCFPGFHSPLDSRSGFCVGDNGGSGSRFPGAQWKLKFCPGNAAVDPPNQVHDRNKNPLSVSTRRADEFFHGRNHLENTIGTSTITAAARWRGGEGAAAVRWSRERGRRL